MEEKVLGVVRACLEGVRRREQRAQERLTKRETGGGGRHLNQRGNLKKDARIHGRRIYS